MEGMVFVLFGRRCELWHMEVGGRTGWRQFRQREQRSQWKLTRSVARKQCSRAVASYGSPLPSAFAWRPPHQQLSPTSDMATIHYEVNVFHGNSLNFYNQDDFNEYSMNNSVDCNKSVRWDSLSPEPNVGFSADFGRVKAESPFDDGYYHQQQSSYEPKTMLVPTASTETAHASLQSAFNRRPSKISFESGSSVKSEILEENLNNFNANFAADSQANTDGAQNLDAQQMDIYRDLILRHLIQDIITTCAKLGLPTDPYNWTEEHGARWIKEMCQQFSLPTPQHIFLSGRVLLSLSLKEFVQMAPESGDTLHAQLQVWKTAFESCDPTGQSSGMTAADNSPPKTSWMTSQTSEIAGSPDPSYFPTGNFNSESLPLGFFQQGVMPSPSNSDMSSSGSVQDMNEDDLDMGMMNLQGNGMFPHQQYMRGQMGDMCPTPGDRGEERSYQRHSGNIHLWHFIRELLDQPKQYGSCVRWVDREEGTFKIESSHHLARFWGQRKNRSQMNYDKLSRSLRQYYKKGIIQKPEKKQRLVYKFLPPYNL
ncbi:unnamed protein product [Caenorhabditis auriculariae]|uniref:Uncharacterized protein n=1 Tax=Caenorhabditis auriculariae TaxID=2777116 RepID=A0A8S1HD35_9PELO|nr:unnamed protein product [Caenorhabditis auriculariae]